MKDEALTSNPSLTSKRQIHVLNRDLACEYRAIIATIVYSEVLKRAHYTTIAEALERHAAEDFQHAKEIAARIVSLGGIPCVGLENGQGSVDEIAMFHLDLDGKPRKVRNYRYPIHSARIPVGSQPFEEIRVPQRHCRDHRFGHGHGAATTSTRQTTTR